MRYAVELAIAGTTRDSYLKVATANRNQRLIVLLR